MAKKIHAIYAGSSVTIMDAGDDPHINKLPFKGTLLLVDQPSQKPPHGSQGHRILVRKKVAQDKLNTLPGMAVNYDASDMDEHDTKHKVGIITKAWMDGDKVEVSGYTWKKDFPEVTNDLKKKNLGMSMELGDVYVANEHSNIWDLTDFVFTGATILKKDAAAYTNTSLSASSLRDKLSLAALKDREEGEKVMAKHVEEKKRKVAAARVSDHDQGNLALITQAITGSLQTVLGPIANEIKASNERVLEGFEELKGLHLIQAAAQDNGDEDDDDEVVLHARGHKEEDDEEEEEEMAAAGKKPFGMSNGSDPSASDGSASDSSDASDASDLEAMEDLELEDASEEPGEVNKDASNRGSKTKVTGIPKQKEHFKGNVAKGRIHSGKENGMRKPFPGLEAAAVQLHTLHASNRKMKKTIKAMAEQAHSDRKKYKNQIGSMQASLEHFADLEGRRSAIPHELTNLAAKAGYNLGEIKANGQMLSVELVDNMFAVAKNQGIVIDPEQRMAMKMQLEEQGLLEDGKIERNYGGRVQ